MNGVIKYLMIVLFLTSSAALPQFAFAGDKETSQEAAAEDAGDQSAREENDGEENKKKKKKKKKSKRKCIPSGTRLSRC